MKNLCRYNGGLWWCLCSPLLLCNMIRYVLCDVLLVFSFRIMKFSSFVYLLQVCSKVYFRRIDWEGATGGRLPLECWTPSTLSCIYGVNIPLLLLPLLLELRAYYLICEKKVCLISLVRNKASLAGFTSPHKFCLLFWIFVWAAEVSLLVGLS